MFCGIVAGTVPAAVVLDNDDVVAFLDARPVFHGHTLVVPRSHVETLPELTPDRVGSVFGAARLVAAALVGPFGADGTFVAINSTVSQSVPHLHVHVVPRHRGDGLRGFFWPRVRYDSDGHLNATAERVRAAIQSTIDG